MLPSALRQGKFHMWSRFERGVENKDFGGCGGFEVSNNYAPAGMGRCGGSFTEEIQCN